MSTIQKIMTMYWKQITGMMKGGLPVVKCLEAAGKECKDETLAGITEKLIQRLYDGDSLSQAMGEFEAYFPAPVIAMVRDGEVKGRLDEAAANIAQGFEDETFNVNELETYVAELLSDEPGEYGSEDTIKTLNLILLEAFKRKASDIHIEWEEGGMVIRYRIDGVLTKVDSPPEKIQKPLIARIKVMAALDIAERRMPQDGRILIKQEGKEYDLRLSTLPTVTGEAVTIRILSRESISLDLGDLGMPEDNLEKIKEMIAQPHGSVFVAGPTGSGKTTTLYAILNYLNDGTKKIISAENPVEYIIPGISQVPINAGKGLTFARVMRSMLRQDPDIMLIGELRDRESAVIMTQGALTGHLMLTTLHTPDAPTTIRRLVDIGVEPFLITNTMLGVIAQRLVRGLCQECREEYEPDDLIGMLGEEYKGIKAFKAKGCDKCGGTGYRGRKAINEILVMDKTLQKEVMSGADPDTLRDLAIGAGMRTFFQDGMELVKKGLTTIEEVLRVAPKVS